MTRRAGAQVYLVAVNLEDRAADAAFTLSGLRSGTAVVLFEDRVVSFADGVLTDAFDAHERHVYRIEMPEG